MEAYPGMAPDRIGDTVRWKGGNIATSEVAAAIITFPGVVDANVYSVPVPAAEGRAGMAEIAGCGDLDIAALREHLVKRISRHALPVLLSICPGIDLTPTFKQQKNTREESVWDPSIGPHALYVHAAGPSAFVPLDLESYERIRAGQFGF
jgi:acyl-CoA synthetase (AMP-forming)/AMP-acid ligase II